MVVKVVPVEQQANEEIAERPSGLTDQQKAAVNKAFADLGARIQMLENEQAEMKKFLKSKFP